MIRGITIAEEATEKTLTIEPSSIGMRLFMCNFALEERMHMDLSLDDMKVIVSLMQQRIDTLELLIKITKEGDEHGG